MDYRKYTAELFLVKVRQYYMNALLEEEWEELSRKIWVYLPTYLYLPIYQPISYQFPR